MSKKSFKTKLASLIKTPFKWIGKVLKKATAPIRSNKQFRKARKSFLKSPFKGYFKDSYSELKKVTWPNRKTTLRLTATVIVFSLTFSVFTSLLDVGFEKIAKKIFLN